MRGIPTSCLPFVIDKEADSQVTAIGVIQEKKCHWDKNATGTKMPLGQETDILGIKEKQVFLWYFARFALTLPP